MSLSIAQWVGALCFVGSWVAIALKSRGRSRRWAWIPLIGPLFIGGPDASTRRAARWAMGIQWVGVAVFFLARPIAGGLTSLIYEIGEEWPKEFTRAVSRIVIFWREAPDGVLGTMLASVLLFTVGYLGTAFSSIRARKRRFLALIPLTNPLLSLFAPRRYVVGCGGYVLGLIVWILGGVALLNYEKGRYELATALATSNQPERLDFEWIGARRSVRGEASVWESGILEPLTRLALGPFKTNGGDVSYHDLMAARRDPNLLRFPTEWSDVQDAPQKEMLQDFVEVSVAARFGRDEDSDELPLPRTWGDVAEAVDASYENKRDALESLRDVLRRPNSVFPYPPDSKMAMYQLRYVQRIWDTVSHGALASVLLGRSEEDYDRLTLALAFAEKDLTPSDTHVLFRFRRVSQALVILNEALRRDQFSEGQWVDLERRLERLDPLEDWRFALYGARAWSHRVTGRFLEGLTPMDSGRLALGWRTLEDNRSQGMNSGEIRQISYIPWLAQTSLGLAVGPYVRATLIRMRQDQLVSFEPRLRDLQDVRREWNALRDRSSTRKSTIAAMYGSIPDEARNQMIDLMNEYSWDSPWRKRPTDSDRSSSYYPHPFGANALGPIFLERAATLQLRLDIARARIRLHRFRHRYERFPNTIAELETEFPETPALGACPWIEWTYEVDGAGDYRIEVETSDGRPLVSAPESFPDFPVLERQGRLQRQ